jgi:hypothetical protein
MRSDTWRTIPQHRISPNKYQCMEIWIPRSVGYVRVPKTKLKNIPLTYEIACAKNRDARAFRMKFCISCDFSEL